MVKILSLESVERSWKVLAAGLGASLAFAIAAGCSSSSTDDPYPDAQSFCTAVAAAECKEVNCGNPVAACETQRTSDCMTTANAAVSAGRKYSSGFVQACLDKTTALYSTNKLTATDLQTQSDTCALVFQGQVPANQTCTTTYDCAGTNVCDPIRKACGPEVMKNAGDGCNNPGEICVTGYYCGQAPGAAASIFTCVARQMTGDACSETKPCIEADFCNASGSCEAQLDQGAACTSSDQCANDGYCDPNNLSRCDLGLSFAPGAPSCNDYGGTSVTTTTDAGHALGGDPDAATVDTDSSTTADAGADAG